MFGSSSSIKKKNLTHLPKRPFYSNTVEFRRQPLKRPVKLSSFSVQKRLIMPNFQGPVVVRRPIRLGRRTRSGPFIIKRHVYVYVHVGLSKLLNFAHSRPLHLQHLPDLGLTAE